MNIRERLVNSGHLVFRSESQKEDLLDVTKTKIALVENLSYLVEVHGHHLEITAIKSDHRDDRDLGPHCHYNGFCADYYPLRSAKEGAYMSPDTLVFSTFLGHVARSPRIYEVGLTPEAWSWKNRTALLGVTIFPDSGGPHIHNGVH